MGVWGAGLTQSDEYCEVYAAYVGCYLVNSWIPFKIAVVGIFTAIFVVAYLVIWITVYISVKNLGRKMNRKLS